MPAPSILTADDLRQRFAHTGLPADPTAVITLPGSEQWPPQLRRQLQSTLTPAAVLIPVFDHRDAGLSLLLTQRSAELKHHAGQVSFPGGRMEPGDADIAATALREAHEEVGIPGAQVDVIGCLSPMPTITGYAVTPVVGLVDAGVQPVPDRTEVEFAFEVPLGFLLDRGNRRAVERELYGQTIRMVEFHFDGHRIWGATAMMIVELIKTLNIK